LGIFLRSSFGKARSSDQARSSDSKIVRFWYGPCATNFVSKRSRKLR